MKLTRITGENEEYFLHMLPENIRNNEELVFLGVIDDEDEAAAAAAFGVAGDMAKLYWLYTSPEKRDRGAASMLLEGVVRMAKELDFSGITADFSADDVYMDSFLAARDFLVGENEAVYFVPIADLVYGEGTDQVAEDFRNRKSFCTCASPRAVTRFASYAKKIGISDKVLARLCPEFSTVKLTDFDEITDCLLVSKTRREELVVEYMESASPLDTAGLMITLQEALLEKEKTEGNLIFTDHHGNSISIVEKLTGQDRDTYKESGLLHAIQLFT